MVVKGVGQSSTAIDDLDIVFVFMRSLSVQRGSLLCAVSYANLSVLRSLLLGRGDVTRIRDMNILLCLD